MAKIDPASITWDEPAGITWDDENKPAKAEDKRPFIQRLLQDGPAGLVRGSGSIGATLLTPYDLAVGNTKSIGNPERRQAMDDAMKMMGVDTEGMLYGGGKLVGEIAGTAGAGGVLANTARLLPGAARVAPALDAVRTAGFSAGGVTGAGGAGLRALGGGVTGGTSAAIVSPEDIGLGAAVGAALPGALQVAGKAGSAVGSAFASSRKKAAQDLAQALNLGDRKAVEAAIAKLNAADELVPGARPTVAQALQTPDAGILQRVVSDSAGGSSLRDVLAGQNAARLAALEGVAPTSPVGLRSAQQDMGEAIIRQAQRGDAAAKQRTRDLFNAVPLDAASIYVPVEEIAAARSKFFGPGSFGPRGAVDEAVAKARELGIEVAPAMKAARGSSDAPSLSQAVRKAGGLAINNASGRRGEVDALRGDLKNLVRQNGGLSPANMAGRMYEAGYIADDGVDTLLNALRNDAFGAPSTSMYDDMTRSYSAARDAAMGEAPGAVDVPKQATLREIQNLRSSLGKNQRMMGREGNDQAAAALGQMKQAIDDKINQVVRGDGLPDENLPIDWANSLSEALKSKRDQVAQFRTGPQADIFRQAGNGAPLVQGGEAAAKFWGARPGLADDVSSFKRLIGDNPKLLGQFRSMVTTEGASTAAASGNLTSKFVRWVDNTLPGLKQAFEPEQVRTLQRIAADIKRAESAAAAGMSRGSNTYQNASNALSLGLLDSPLVNAAANRIPVLGSFTGPALEGLRSTARKTKAERLAGLLGDSGLAAEQLGGLLNMPQSYALPLLGRGGLLSAPILATDQ
jgi:hypothetical protein